MQKLAIAVLVLGAALPVLAQKPRDVNVVNTPTVNVGNTPSVNVTSLPAVQIGNSPNNPLQVHDVATPSRAPFQTQQTIIVQDGFVGENGFVQVPQGKRLVIEYASAEAFVPLGQKLRFSVITQTNVPQQNPANTRHFLPPAALGMSGDHDGFTAGQVVKLFSDPGTIVDLRTDRDQPVGVVTVFFSISGYQEDAP